MRDFAKIITSVDTRQPWYSFAYTLLLAGAAGATLLLADWSGFAVHWKTVAFFAGLAALAEAMYVELPLGRGRVSVSFAIELGAILLLPPHEAALVAASGVFVANVLQRLAADIILFNAGQIWTTAGATALFWQAVKPVESLKPLEAGDLPAILLTVIGCAAVYFAVNAVLFAVGISLAHRIPLKDVLNKNAIWILPNHFALASLGFLVAVVYLEVGVYGLLLLWIPLLIARYSFQQYMDIRAAHLQTIQALAAALDAKDPYTHGHSERVSKYAVEIGKAMNLPQREIEKLHYAGLLHDIGKIGISDTVLNKVGKLTSDELKLVKSHAEIGARMVQPVGFLRGVSEVIRHHHERVDGRGYPDGLKGDEIPIGARIMAVADAFDAMTYDRVYRPGLAPQAAVRQLELGKGSQFDPLVVDVFIDKVLPKHMDLAAGGSAARPQADGGAQGDSLWNHAGEVRGDGTPARGETASALDRDP